MVAYTCNPSTGEAEAGGTQGQGQLRFQTVKESKQAPEILEGNIRVHSVLAPFS